MTAEELLIRKSVVVASAAIYWAGVAVNAQRLRRRLGRSPNIKPRGLKERLLWFGWLLVVAGWAGQPLAARSSGPPSFLSFLPALTSTVLLIIGFALILAGYLGTLWCYVSLGESWRIGVNRKERIALVRQGPYRIVRHPIYSCQIVILAGMTCLIPTVLSVLIVTLHLACVIVKALDEERYLEETHASAYREYAGQTGMLLPRWKTLRPLFKVR